MTDPKSGRATVCLLLAHGAGAPMTSPFMEAFARRLPDLGIGVARFEFAYMAARRHAGARRPPPRAETLICEYLTVVDRIPAGSKLVIGGKSMGGRVASLVADELYRSGRIQGLVCLGYPFHPSRQPAKPRTAHLEHLCCPAVFVQGERDPLGSRLEAAGYRLSSAIRIYWIANGGHDLLAGKKAGRGAQETWTDAAKAVAAFVHGL